MEQKATLGKPKAIMKTILIPIDFSSHSRITAHFGLELANRVNARVVLLHVVSPSTSVPAFGIPVVELSTWNDSLSKQMTGAMQYFQDQLSDFRHQQNLDSVPIYTRLVVGTPADGILEVAETEKASFIVMGTVGAANVWDQLLGSVSATIAKRSNRPVWIVPQEVKLDSLRRIAYFADMDGNEMSCINQVVNLGERLQSALEVVHVAPVDNEGEEDVFIETIVESFEDDYDSSRITFRHLTSESVSEGVESYVRTHLPDAIVLAHRDRTFIQNLFHTSLIRHLSLTTKRPLLVIPKQS